MSAEGTGSGKSLGARKGGSGSPWPVVQETSETEEKKRGECDMLIVVVLMASVLVVVRVALV